MPHRRSKGTGSVYRSGNRWIAQLELGVIGGKRKVRRYSFASQKQAQQHLKAISGAVTHGKPPAVAAYLADALAGRAHRLAPSTLRSYSRTIDLHIAPFLGHLKVDELTPDVLDGWIRTLRVQGRGTRTMQNARTILRALLRGALRADWLLYNPVARSEPIKHRKREIQPLTQEQAVTVLAACQGHWIEPIILVLLGLGLRLGEALGLQWQDIDFAANRVQIRRTVQRVYVREPRIVHFHVPKAKRRMASMVAALCGLSKTDLLGATKPIKTELVEAPPKTSQSRRTLALPFVIAERLALHQQEFSHLKSPWVFCTMNGTPYAGNNIHRVWRQIRKTAGLPSLRLHDLRHSTATFLMTLGIPTRAVADILGHAETRTTLNIYQHVLPSVTEDTAAKVDALLRTFQPKGKPS